MRKWICAVAMIMSISTRMASAEIFIADGVRVDLPIPAGYCLFDKANRIDNYYLTHMSENIRGMNELVAMAADCRALAAARDGAVLDNYLTWLLNATGGSPLRIPAGMARETVLTKVHEGLPKVDFNKVMSELRPMAQREGLAIEMKASGVLKKTPDRLYLGLLMNSAMVGGKPQPDNAGIVGFVVVKDRIFTVNVYQKHTDARTYDILMARAEDLVTRAYAANAPAVPDLPPGMTPVQTTAQPLSPDLAARVYPLAQERGMDWGRIVGKALAGAILAGLIGAGVAVFRRMRKKNEPEQ